jgi:UDP-N-acetylglucosamine:LPS N-acetylglucosamine transferase
MKEIAYFITSHGLGHVMRATAVLEELAIQRPDIHPHLFTTVPKELFNPPLENFTHHKVITDIGMVQSNAFHADLEETVKQLDTLLPYDHFQIDNLAKKCANCALIFCDISPIGIEIGKKIGIPSVLVENFTWDWIYSPYAIHNKDLECHAEYLASLFKKVDYHIQTEPLCKHSNNDLLCGPISRKIQKNPASIREELGSGNRKAILISMGGIHSEIPYLERVQEFQDYYFILAGQKKSARIYDNLLTLERTTKIYHPDLINTVDLVLCKSGYSTISECYRAQTTLAAISRSVFPESRAMESFITDKMGGAVLREDDLITGRWFEMLESLLHQKAKPPKEVNGAVEVCKLVSSII